MTPFLSVSAVSSQEQHLTDLNKLKRGLIQSLVLTYNQIRSLNCFYTATNSFAMILTRHCPEVLLKIVINRLLLAFPSFLLLDKIMDYHYVYFSAIISREWAVLVDVYGLFGHRCVAWCVCVWGGGDSEATRGAAAAGMQRLGVAAAVAVALWC